MNKPRMVGEIKAVYQTKDQLEQVTIVQSKDAYDYLKRIWPTEINMYEAFMVLFLNRRNKILGYSLISIGSTTGTVCDGKKIFQHALLAHATSIVLAHNHPSGYAMPSDEDLKLTSNLINFGKMITLEVLDHIILTEDSYYSFADEGRIL